MCRNVKTDPLPIWRKALSADLTWICLLYTSKYLLVGTSDIYVIAETTDPTTGNAQKKQDVYKRQVRHL